MRSKPDSMSILEAYDQYRKHNLLVNRLYQRKLVWTQQEKQLLIDSIFKQYALPSFLFSKSADSPDTLEILDGMQRLTAIFDFIENRIDYNGKYFDIDAFPAARLAAQRKAFKPQTDKTLLLSNEKSVDFVGYALSTNIIDASRDETIDLFRRINSQGRLLSNQDRRRSGVTSEFSSIVDSLSSSIRGDISSEIIDLMKMPSISLTDSSQQNGYGISIDDMFWFKTGILNRQNIRHSDDEELIADLVASVLSDRPFAASQENFDRLYSEDDSMAKTLEVNLKEYGAKRLQENFLHVFSVINEILIVHQPKDTNFKKTVSKSHTNTNPAKYAFYAFFMAVFNLVIGQNQYPSNFEGIWNGILGLEQSLRRGSHSANVNERTSNIDSVKGRISNFFTLSEQEKNHASSEYVLTRLLAEANGESSLFEFKIGFYNDIPNKKSSFNPDVISKICKVATSLANTPQKRDKYIFIGIADSDESAQLYQKRHEKPIFKIGKNYIVGVERDLFLSELKWDSYLQKIITLIQKQPISKEMRVMLTSPNTYAVNGLRVLAFRITSTRTPEKYEDKYYERIGNSVSEVSDSDRLIQLTKLLNSNE
ncbi:DUF262 domain-containing protein [Lacticaseibacillus jixianensis]|uniref:DUF262 domain-containing protein n=1 Tax=Lacticaseibacillus jixianensis TaxID=2486012 RepID=A0ABW4B4U6_9LACO|nr:DUF262 domain-containing protein [Lacticaseibacillus jixianensis]